MNDEFFDGVVESWTTALSRIQYSGADIHWVEIRKLLKSLAESDLDKWSLSDFSVITNDLFGDAKKLGDDVKKHLSIDYLDLLATEDHMIRFTTDAERKNESFVSGTRVAECIREGTEPQKLLANNYCLAFPERMAMLWYFSLPGEAKSTLNKIDHHFLFHKKVNSVLSSYFVEDAKSLGMLEEKQPHGLRLGRLPDNALAYLTTRCYLQVSDHMIDIGVSGNDVENQLGYFVSAKHFYGPWRKRFSPKSVTVFQAEMANSQIRLLPEGFNWMVGCGLVDPIDIAKTLKKYDATKQIKKIGTSLKSRIEKAAEKATEPVNLNDFLAHFNC